MRAAFALLFAAVSCSPHHDLPALSDASPSGVADAAPAVAYPPGPYGGGLEATVPDLTFEGYHAGSDVWGTLSLRDYYDPDGAKGIRALVVVIVAEWCNVCAAAATDVLPPAWNQFTPRGTRFLQLMTQGANFEPSRRDQADRWRVKYIVPFDNGIDPTYQTNQLMPLDENGVPNYLIIDPRTMKIAASFMGRRADGNLPGLEALLTRNGASAPP